MSHIHIIAFSQDRAIRVANAFGIPSSQWSRLCTLRSTVGLHEPKVLDCGLHYRETSEKRLGEYADILRELRERSKADRVSVGEPMNYASFIPTAALRNLFRSADPQLTAIAFEIIRAIATACKALP